MYTDVDIPIQKYINTYTGTDTNKYIYIYIHIRIHMPTHICGKGV